MRLDTIDGASETGMQVGISVIDGDFSRKRQCHSFIALPLALCCLSAGSCTIVDLIQVEKLKRAGGFQTQVRVIRAPITAPPIQLDFPRSGGSSPHPPEVEMIACCAWA